MIILDTDVLIEIFDKSSVKGDFVISKLEETGEDIAITSLNLHEILYGIKKYGKKKVKNLDQLETIAFTDEDARLSSQLELDCERKGKPIFRIDSMIAGIVINRKAKLYTFKKKNFESFDSLQLI